MLKKPLKLQLAREAEDEFVKLEVIGDKKIYIPI